MTTATKERQGSGLEIGHDLLDGAEDVLESIVSEGRSDPTEGELAYFASLGWDRRKIRLERQRVHRRRQLQQQAGTQQQRTRARTEADKARAEADTELPNIEQQIQQLEQRRVELTSKRDSAEAEALELERAHEQLHSVEYLPPHRRDEAQRIKRQVWASHRGSIEGARRAVSLARKVIALQPSDSAYERDTQACIRYCREHLPEALVEHVTGGHAHDEKGRAVEDARVSTWHSFTVDKETFDKHQADQRERLPELERTLSGAEAAHRAELDAALSPMLGGLVDE